MMLRPHGLLELRDQLVRATTLARDVVTDMQDALRAGRRREQRVKRCDSPRIRGRHGETRANVVQRTLADPADTRLHGVQRRQQQVAHGARVVSAERDMGVADGIADAAVPPRRWRSEECVDRLTLLAGRFGVEEMEIHQSPAIAMRRPATVGRRDGRACTFTTCTAQALNSAVPDFGSNASIVRKFVAT